MTLDYWFDIGNTRAKFWVTRDGHIAYRGGFPHHGDMEWLLAGLPVELEPAPQRLYGLSVLDAGRTEAFVAAALQRWGMVPQLAASDALHAGIQNGYESPSRLGVDRWLGVLAAAGEGKACVVLCGTAITLDLVEQGRHAGGYIIPGLSLMASSLIERTRGIRCDVAPSGGIGPGRNTSDAVARGGLLAAAGCIERVVRQEQASRLILAGGDAERVSESLSISHFVDPDLLLKGLQVYFGRGGRPEHQ